MNIYHLASHELSQDLVYCFGGMNQPQILHIHILIQWLTYFNFITNKETLKRKHILSLALFNEGKHYYDREKNPVQPQKIHIFQKLYHGVISRSIQRIQAKNPFSGKFFKIFVTKTNFYSQPQFLHNYDQKSPHIFIS